nr:AAA domain protein [uncultured bacterium]
MTKEALKTLIFDTATKSKKPIVIAFDGRSGVGKSTLVRDLREALGAAVIDGDDFYSGGDYAVWAARTAEQNAAACIDWQRLKQEALLPLLQNRPAQWHAFDWDKGVGVGAKASYCQPNKTIFLDGTYSSRPELQGLITISVLVTVPENVRVTQLAAREGGDYNDPMQHLWAQAEHYYFTHVRPPRSFDVVLSLQ